MARRTSQPTERATKLPDTTNLSSPRTPGIGHNQPPALFDDRLTVSIDETAAALGVGRDTVYVMISDGRLVASKFGKRTVIHTASIRQLLERTRLVLRPRARTLARAARRAAP
jgi:excisionase family DNA binding protein